MPPQTTRGTVRSCHQPPPLKKAKSSLYENAGVSLPVHCVYLLPDFKDLCGLSHGSPRSAEGDEQEAGEKRPSGRNLWKRRVSGRADRPL
ncbi:hypothetical protein SKAU_G00311140 [Synaphobranchus kaupii]|uniref:Uncharacterized protein n=1 Tax=Synaphobranchus kaupii TaxID=118154 RepID=A0A9Q1ERP0_SYNKA|nr:hypothetical protein SKAU_G00311140 [Synaphobranchus kaupii]